MAAHFHIADLNPSNERAQHALAVLLVEGFRELAPMAWPNLDAAREEVQDALAPGRINRVALGADGDVLGWIGGSPQYDGHVWEVHPLVVAPRVQQQGIGRALVNDLEARARERGALTL